MTDLRACPFCGHEKISNEDRQSCIGPVSYFYKHFCDACLCEGGDANSLERSIELWNTRVARPGDTFTGPNGEKLVAVPVEFVESSMDCVKLLRKDAEKVGPLHAYWDDIFEFEKWLAAVKDG